MHHLHLFTLFVRDIHTAVRDIHTAASVILEGWEQNKEGQIGAIPLYTVYNRKNEDVDALADIISRHIVNDRCEHLTSILIAHHTIRTTATDKYLFTEKKKKEILELKKRDFMEGVMSHFISKNIKEEIERMATDAPLPTLKNSDNVVH